MAKRKKRVPVVYQSEKTKRSSLKLTQPVYPLGEGIQAVVLCIPDDVQFVIALQTALAYWEAPHLWDRDIGQEYYQFKSDWGRMIANMQCIDLEQLNQNTERIAVALESIDDKTPDFLSLQDVVDALDDSYVGNLLNVVAPIIDILRAFVLLFPSLSLKIDGNNIIKEILANVFWRGKWTVAFTAMAASLATIAGAQVASAGASVFDSVLSYYGKLENFFSSLKDEILNGVTNIWDDDWQEPVNAVTEQDRIGAERNLRLHEQNVILTAVGEGLLGVADRVAKCICEGSGGCCTCGGGIVLDPPTVEIGGGGGPPVGFVDCAAYETYKCKFANWATDKFVEFVTRIDNMPEILRNFEQDAHEGNTYSIGQLNAVIGAYVVNSFDPLFVANMTAANMGMVTTKATQWAVDWLSSVTAAGGEGDLPTIEQEYFTTPLTDFIAELATDKNATLQDIFANGDDTDTVLSTLEGWINTAIGNTVSFKGAHTDFFGNIVTKGIAGLGFALADGIEAYLAAVPCTGNTSCVDGWGPLIYNATETINDGTLDVDTWDGTERRFQLSGITYPPSLHFFADFTNFTNGNPGVNKSVDMDIWITHASDGFNTHQPWRYYVRGIYEDLTTTDFIAYQTIDQNGTDRWVSAPTTTVVDDPLNPLIGLQLRVIRNSTPKDPESALLLFRNMVLS